METIPKQMSAVVLTGHGGFEQLHYREDVPVPLAGDGEVLIKVAAAGVNNTDINTRIAWYSKNVSVATGQGGASGFNHADDADASWCGTPLSFPRIQGADVCGHIVAVGGGVESARIGERVLVRNMLRSYVDYRPFECWTIGSECDGGFAQYVKAPARETYAVNCDWSDAELGSVPCAYSTAECMLQRAAVGSERVLISGASGGVGSAAVQLAKIRGAEVIAIAKAAKAGAVKKLGADAVVDGDDVARVVAAGSVDVVVDVVVGERWGALMKTLKTGGRYVTAGAIAGPMVELDMRDLYLRDLSFFGCTFQSDAVFDNVVQCIESGQLKPVIGKTYPLRDIVRAQQDFIAKKYAGKLVLIPPD